MELKGKIFPYFLPIRIFIEIVISFLAVFFVGALLMFLIPAFNASYVWWVANAVTPDLNDSISFIYNIWTWCSVLVLFVVFAWLLIQSQRRD